MSAAEKDAKAQPSKDFTHQGSWFRVPGRNLWHTEAHREYGVLWSPCGLRALALQAETKDKLEPDDRPCTKCSGPPRRS